MLGLSTLVGVFPQSALLDSRKEMTSRHCLMIISDDHKESII